MTSEKKEVTEEEKRGYRRAHLAAFYANVRVMIAGSLRDDDPVLGFHGFYITENFRTLILGAGMTPDLSYMLSYAGSMQGRFIMDYVARQAGWLAEAHVGDTFDVQLGAPRCESCDDGDPDGSHAKRELEENARAWIGLTILVAERFYGPHLPAEAHEPLEQLMKMALPADEEVK